MKTPPASPEPTYPPGPLRVLLVDDMPQVLFDLKQLLELSGKVQVVGTAREGTEAIRLAKEASPQVILMDLEMPVMDGFEATRRIKAENSAMRVIILSVHGEQQAQQDAQEAGADGYVIKGARYEVLLEAIFSRKSIFPNEGVSHE